jgi:hypothetical protein
MLDFLLLEVDLWELRCRLNIQINEMSRSSPALNLQWHLQLIGREIVEQSRQRASRALVELSLELDILGAAVSGIVTTIRTFDISDHVELALKVQVMADLLICRTCGVQFSASSIEELNNECPICLDPRQYVPPLGQSWTTLSTLRADGKYKNLFHPMDADETSSARLLAIRTEPQVAIGQSAYLVRTPQGNILWDCITYLDNETIEAIKEYGGLKAIVISHPHFYSTHVEYFLIHL